MKKAILLLFFLLKLFFSSSMQIDSLTLIDQNLFFYHTNLTSERLIIFLHGEVTKYKLRSENKLVKIDTLLHDNKEFVSVFSQVQYDIVVPIAFKNYNWFEKEGDYFVHALLEKFKKTHKEIYLAGFSDGATGAYRIFHQDSKFFSGLILFNAFPQRENQHLKTNYKRVIDKKIVYVSQKDDDINPYELSLVDYRRQKLLNLETFFLLYEGDQSFKNYHKEHFDKIISIINRKNQTPLVSDTDFWIYPPIDALVVDNVIEERYEFRKKVGKKLGISKQEVLSQEIIQQTLKELKDTNKKINFLIKIVNKNELDVSKTLQFQFISDRVTYTFEIDNYLLLDTWEMDKNY